MLCCSIALSSYAQDPQTFAANLRAGESINGFPNWAERVLLEWMNRARVDPQKELAPCGAACGEAACYKPVAPLVWSEPLNHAARFHADEMTKQHFFAHDSACAIVSNIDALYPVGCDASASCACTDGTATAWNARVGLFGAGAYGEIIAGTGDPSSAFYLWLYEPSANPSCGASYGNLHRYLILGSGGAIGLGATTNAVADFGGGAEPYKIPSAAHYPKQADSVTLWANWYDTSGPTSANAIVDGKCIALSLQRGTPQNGAWSATASGVGSGCHRYWFSFVDGSGAIVNYPATGSLGIGDPSCDDWNATRVNASCSSTSRSAKRRAARHR